MDFIVRNPLSNQNSLWKQKRGRGRSIPPQTCLICPYPLHLGAGLDVENSQPRSHRSCLPWHRTMGLGITNLQAGAGTLWLVTRAFVASTSTSSQLQLPPPGVRYPFSLGRGNPQLCWLPALGEGRMRPENRTK